MRTRVLVPALAAAVFAHGVAYGLNVSIAQIDSTMLLPAQIVKLYVSLTDAAGDPVEDARPEDFRLSESADGQTFRPVERIVEWRPRAGSTDGITFLLLIDNSGSMYDGLDGRATGDSSAMRITHAKDAIRSFLADMTNPRDAAGLVSYNTFYRKHADPLREKGQIAGLLDSIRRPAEEEAYTELYASLELAAQGLRGVAGRKAIIILSDGENYPYAQYSGKEHPDFGSRIAEYGEPIRTCQEEGVTVYAINFGTQRDGHLQAIAWETGGQIFDASDRGQLESVYRAIHEQVRGEYLVRYRATMDPAERKYVRVQLGDASATRFYFAGTVFGAPVSALSPLLLIPIVASALALWLISLLKLERRPGPASLEVLQTRVGRPSTRVMQLSSAKTVIGGSRKADLTIAGAPDVREQHATILYDAKKKAYTVVASGGEITVNNQPAATRILEAGDVIDVGGATIVFDAGEEPST